MSQLEICYTKVISYLLLFKLPPNVLFPLRNLIYSLLLYLITTDNNYFCNICIHFLYHQKSTFFSLARCSLTALQHFPHVCFDFRARKQKEPHQVSSLESPKGWSSKSSCAGAISWWRNQLSLLLKWLWKFSAIDKPQWKCVCIKETQTTLDKTIGYIHSSSDCLSAYTLRQTQLVVLPVAVHPCWLLAACSLAISLRFTVTQASGQQESRKDWRPFTPIFYREETYETN